MPTTTAMATTRPVQDSVRCVRLWIPLHDFTQSSISGNDHDDEGHANANFYDRPIDKDGHNTVDNDSHSRNPDNCGVRH